MKNVIKRALLKAAICILSVFIIMTVLQYVPLIHPTWVDGMVSIPSSGDHVIDRRAIIHKAGFDVPWFLYLWPFNHPQNILPSD